MEELCDESNIYNENDKCTTFQKFDDDLWNNTSSMYYASTDFYVNNFTNISELDREDEQFRKKFDPVLCENPLKNPLIPENESTTKNNPFVVNKRHNYKCKHLANISKSIRKNKIKLSLEDDFLKILEDRFVGKIKNFFLLVKKINPVKSFEKSSKNRKFRLFDKDVIIKKIICHFYKFVSSITSSIEKQLKIKLKLHETVKLKKRNQTSFKSLIHMNIAEFDFNDYTSNPSVLKFLSLSILEIFREFFLNSQYFQEITENFQKKHGELYFQYFIMICSEFPNCIFNNFKNTGKKSTKKIN